MKQISDLENAVICPFSFKYDSLHQNLSSGTYNARNIILLKKKKKKSVDFACGIFSNDLLFQSSLPAEKNLVDIPLSV